MDTSHTAPPPAGTAPLGASLRRTTDDRVLLGLCGGIARSAGASPLIVRLATLILSLLLLPFVVAAYLGTALIVPRDDGSALLGTGNRDSRDVIVALLSLAIAAPLVLGTAGSGIFGGLDAWPAVLTGSVVLFALAIWRPRWLFGARGDRSGTAGGPRTWTPTTGAHGAAASSAPSTVATTQSAAHTVSPGFGDPFHDTVSGPYPDVEPSEAATIVGGAAGSDDREPVDLTKDVGAPDSPPTTPQFAVPPLTPPAAPQPRRRSIALPIFSVLALVPALFVVAIVAGVVDHTWTAWSVMLAIMAVGAAAGAVAIAFVRPSYLGAGFLVALAAVLGAGAVGVNQLGPVLDDGVGTHIYKPATTSELLPSYILGVGELDVDLRDLKLRPGTTTLVHTKIGFGKVRVMVPRGVRVVAAPGSDVPELSTTARRNGASEKSSASAPVIALDAQVRGGEVDLLSGAAKYPENMTVLASATHGFWGTNDRVTGTIGRWAVTLP